jgi:uroporphyrinogen III methyltransferase / synthase
LGNHDKTQTSAPLAAKRIVVTRSPEQAGELVRALESQGATVLLLPTVSFAAPEDPKELEACLSRLAEFDWILFTSQNAVRFLCGHWRKTGRDPAALPSLLGRVAAVGSATAQAVQAEGLEVDYVAQTETGESLGFELRDAMAGKKILLPRSDRADDRLPSMLSEAGASVHEVIAYRTLPPRNLDAEILAQVRAAKVDAVVFASPSAFHNLAAFIPSAELAELSARVAFATIGATTSRALNDAGMRVAVESKHASSTGLVDAIAKYYQRQAAAVRLS